MASRSSLNGLTAASNFLRSIFARLNRISRARVWRRRPRRLRLCETLSLGNRGFLAVVRFENQQFLVGGTNSSIAMLAQLSPAPPLEVELPEEEYQAT